MEKYFHNELTDKIIKAFYKVYNELGFGFLEKVYENALCFGKKPEIRRKIFTNDRKKIQQ